MKFTRENNQEPTAPPKEYHHRQQGQNNILPTLTDDMFVINAPSLVIPFVYEKPPRENLKRFIDRLNKSDLSEEKDQTKRNGSNFNNQSEQDNWLLSNFDRPVGKFLTSIGTNLVQEHVQRNIWRKQCHQLKSNNQSRTDTPAAMDSLKNILEHTKANNEPFHFKQKKCKFCNFRTESSLAMQKHLEIPHQFENNYVCNVCPFVTRSPHDILLHMKKDHGIGGRIELPLAGHVCPNCPFEISVKRKYDSHAMVCQKKFQLNKNLEPESNWEFPTKPSSSANRSQNFLSSMNALARKLRYNNQSNQFSGGHVNNNIESKNQISWSGLLPANPLKSASPVSTSQIKVDPSPKQERSITCEICDGILKDLKDMRIHVRLMHNIRIHEKLLTFLPPIKCPKCELRFYTDEGIARHLLRVHGLVISNSICAEKVGKDSGDCSECKEHLESGLLSHMSSIHGIKIKNITLQYRCKVCHIDYDLYKNFETHVYWTHGKYATKAKDNKGWSTSFLSSYELNK